MSTCLNQGREKIVHKNYECPADGIPLVIADKVNIYTHKAQPEFELVAYGKESSVSFAKKRTKEEAWGLVVDKALVAKRAKK